MSFLLDASAILNLSSAGKLNPLLQGKTITLAYYEVGNALWNQIRIHRLITLEEGLKALDTLYKTIDEIEKVPLQEPKTILEVSTNEGITYYDASYIHAARLTGSKLVTDDNKLRSIAEKYVETMTSEKI